MSKAEEAEPAMTMTRIEDSNGRSITLTRQLGAGGQGEVFQVQDRPDVVAKVYLKAPSPENVRKLEAQVRACRPEVRQISAWPSAILKDADGGVRGLLMPLVDPGEYQEIHNLFGPASRRKYFPKANWSFLVHVARNVARAFAVLHAEGHVVGDVSSRNILVSQRGTVCLIDTDSFQVKSGGSVFPCPVGTAESTPPELQGQTFGSLIRDANHDRFGLAVMLFQLLFQGRHPYSGVHADGSTPNPAQAIRADAFAYSLKQHNGVRPPPQTLSLSDLTPAVGELFERAFAPTHASRPSAAEWDRALEELGRALTTCARDPAHQHVRGKPCPWCGSVQVATTKTGAPGGATRLDVNGELNRIWRGVQAIPVPPPPAEVTLSGTVPAVPPPAPPVLNIRPLDPRLLRRAGVRRGFAFALLLLGVWLASMGAGWEVLTALGFVVWLLWINSNTKKIERADRSNQRSAIARETRQLEGQLSALERQRQLDSAYQKYRLHLRALEDRRAALVQLGAAGQQGVQAVIDRYRGQALDQYLERQALAVGQINGIGPALIVTLRQSGYRTAKDIDARVSHVKGIGPSRARDLMHWRRAQAQFFQFNPASVPKAELLAAQRSHDQQVSAQLQALERDVVLFAAKVKVWREAERQQVEAIWQTLRDIEQRKALLRRLGEVGA